MASFHLVREPAWRAPVALARLGTDRLRLRGTPGLRFARLLGTGSGAAATGRGPRPQRAVRDLGRHRRARRLTRRRLVRRAGRSGAGPGRGGLQRDAGPAVRATAGGAAGTSWPTWPCRRPEPRGPPAGRPRGGGPPGEGPVAVLTRATVRPSRWHRFRGARPPVSARARRGARAARRRRDRRGADRAAGDVQPVGRRRRRRRLRPRPAAPRRRAAHAPRALVRRGAVRPVRADRLVGHLGRARPAVRR